jgi:predicted transcriptional regulator
MRTTEIITISLPPAMVQQFEEVRKKESRTRSELMREALRVYFELRYPVVSPTKAELSALRRGRAALRRGDTVSLSELLNNVASRPHRTGSKKLPKTTSRRSKAR